MSIHFELAGENQNLQTQFADFFIDDLPRPTYPYFLQSTDPLDHDFFTEKPLVWYQNPNPDRGFNEDTIYPLDDGSYTSLCSMLPSLCQSEDGKPRYNAEAQNPESVATESSKTIPQAMIGQV